MKQTTRALFQFDPGWLFVAAGLAVCAAGIILPAQNDLQGLQRQLQQLHQEETRAFARLKAHSDFMDQVDRADPALVRRLAAAQLNLVPEGDTPVLLASNATSPVTDWIDGTVNVDIRPPAVAGISTLSELANGPMRLWLFGGGIMAVFVGLMLAPSPVRMRRGGEMVEESHDAIAVTMVDETEFDIERGLPEIEVERELMPEVASAAFDDSHDEAIGIEDEVMHDDEAAHDEEVDVSVIEVGGELSDALGESQFGFDDVGLADKDGEMDGAENLVEVKPHVAEESDQIPEVVVAVDGDDDAAPIEAAMIEDESDASNLEIDEWADDEADDDSSDVRRR